MSGQNWGNVTVKVSTDVLKRQANEVSRRISSLTTRFVQLESVVRNTRGYWIGEAGEMHRSVYEEQKEDVELMLRRLKEHPTDLLRIAGIYEETEAKQVDLFQSLEENVIA